MWLECTEFKDTLGWCAQIPISIGRKHRRIKGLTGSVSELREIVESKPLEPNTVLRCAVRLCLPTVEFGPIIYLHCNTHAVCAVPLAHAVHAVPLLRLIMDTDDPEAKQLKVDLEQKGACPPASASH